MARSTALRLIAPGYVVPSQPIGDPIGDTTPVIQRALDTLNNVAYRTRGVMFAWQQAEADRVTFTVPVGVTGTLWEWRAHVPEGIATLQVAVRWRLSVGGTDVVFRLERNGTSIASLTPTASGLYVVTVATSSAIASGDATFSIVAGGGASGSGTLDLVNLWVCYATQTVP